MQKNMMTGLLLAALLAPLASANADVRELASSPRWLTTKVYLDGAPETDVKAKYPGVVGISTWDPERNRYEFFYTDTGESKYNNGGAVTSLSPAISNSTFLCRISARPEHGSDVWKH